VKYATEYLWGTRFNSIA